MKDNSKLPFRWWFITRGNISAKETLDDIMARWKVDDYTTKVSFVEVSKQFATLKEAKAWSKGFDKWLWKGAGAWHEQEDMDVGGLQQWRDGEWQDLE